MSDAIRKIRELRERGLSLKEAKKVLLDEAGISVEEHGEMLANAISIIAQRDRLAHFFFPMPRVPVPQKAVDFVAEYWEWRDGQWRNLNDWYVDDTGRPTGDKTHCKTTRGCESEYAWRCLLETAKLFGFEDDSSNNEENAS